SDLTLRSLPNRTAATGRRKCPRSVAFPVPGQRCVETIPMRHAAMVPSVVSLSIGLALFAGPGLTTGKHGDVQAQPSTKALSANDRQIGAYAQRMLEDGRRIFRYDTFGSEAFWGDALQLHKAIAGE